MSQGVPLCGTNYKETQVGDTGTVRTGVLAGAGGARRRVLLRLVWKHEGASGGGRRISVLT